VIEEVMTGKVLVTGGSGVVGSAVRRELAAQGYDVIAPRSADVDLTKMDDTVDFFRDVQPDVVVHLAARVHGLMGHVRAQGAVYLDNILINTHVVEASRLAGVGKVVAMGSTAVYSDQVQLPMSEDEIWLGSPHGSELGYAHAKRAMLAQLDCYRDQYGLDYAFAISTNVYGPDDKFDEEKGHVIPSLVSRLHRARRDGQPFTVWGTGSPTRDFLFSSDAAHALRLVMEHHTGAVNIASGRSVTIKDTVEALVAAAEFTGEVVWDRSKPDGQAARAYDITRLEQLGWKPEWSLGDGLAETFQWYCDHEPDVRR
jgi:GDP-L-fucose synthase